MSWDAEPWKTSERMVNQGCMCMGSVDHSVMFPHGCQRYVRTELPCSGGERKEGERKTFQLNTFCKALI